MQALIDPLLVSCFQFLPQTDIPTAYLKANGNFPVSDESIHKESRLKEFITLLTVNRRWNKVLKQFSKSCWNNCCYIILESSYFVSAAKFLVAYPYLNHIDFFALDPSFNADYKSITMMDHRTPMSDNRLKTVMNSIKHTIKKMAFLVWHQESLSLIWECTQLEWLALELEQFDKRNPNLDGIVSLQKLKHLTVTCKYGVSKNSFRLISRLPLLESLFHNVGQYPDHNLIEYFTHLKCYDLHFGPSAESTLEGINIPESLDKLVARCYAKIFPITDNLARQLKSLIIQLNGSNLDDEVLLGCIVANLEKCPNLQQFQLLKIEEKYRLFPARMESTQKQTLQVETEIRKLIFESCYIDGYFRPNGKQHLIENLKNFKMYELLYGG